jgi:antitoxin YefM
MKSKTYTEARERLSDIIEKVCENHDPLIISKCRDKAVVMMSLEDYEAPNRNCISPAQPTQCAVVVEIDKGTGGRERVS